MLKVETLNPIRSFKGRGAEVLAAALRPGEAVACASAGNFGQAMAWSCRRRGVPLTVWASVAANPLKIERMRALGARVVLEGEDFDAAKLAGKRASALAGVRFVEDGRDPEPALGAGTLALELLALAEPLDALLVPLGNGALLAGVAHVLRARAPRTRIVAVQAAGAPAMVESLRAGRVVERERIDTIADGIGVRVPIAEALDDLRGMVDDARLVSEAALVEAMRLLHRRAGLVAEPSGAAGVAALLEHAADFRGARVGTVVCGGNLTEAQMDAWLR